MPCQQPCIVEGNNRGHSSAEARQLPEVEVIPVKVMQMQHVWQERSLLQQVPRTWESEIFMPRPPGPEPRGRGQPRKPAFRKARDPPSATGVSV